MTGLSSFAISGIVFGLTGGLTPGPTTALVIAQTLRFGAREGCKVAIAPLLTDAPIILAAVFAVSRLAAVEGLLGVVSLGGAAFLAYLGLSGLRPKLPEIDAGDSRPYSLVKGVLANGLNPHPYLFWFAVGGPILVRAAELGPGAVALFLVSLFGCLVGAKIGLALIAARGRSWLRSRAYLNVLRALGLVLLVFALMFLREGLQRLGWLT